MRVLFLDCIQTPYNSSSIRNTPVGGIGVCTAALAETFVLMGHDVTVINQVPENQSGIHHGVMWQNYDTFSDNDRDADIVIANNDAKLLSQAHKIIKNGAIPVLWLHNRILLEKTIRKARMVPLLRYRPYAVFLGEKQKSATSQLHPFRKKYIIPHGLSQDYLGFSRNAQSPAPTQAIYFSQAYRGFAETVEIWIKHVAPKAPDSVLKAFLGDNITLKELGISYSLQDLERSKIMLMPKIPKDKLIQELKNTRVMIYPGHKDETFCNAAAEASALGVPIVTYGRGSLSERVEHGKNGFIIQDKDDIAMGESVVKILKDDKLWQSLSEKAARDSQCRSWFNCAKMWEKMVFVHAG